MANQGSSSSSPSLDLPRGFYFCPSPEDLLEYVRMKNSGVKLGIEIHEIDILDHHPKTLSGNFKYGTGNEMYYFTKLQRMNRGKRLLRSTKECFWKSVDKFKEIMDSKSGNKIGHQRTFTCSETIDGTKSNWTMHQFHYTSSEMSAANSTENSDRNMTDYFVLCKITKSTRSSSSHTVSAPHLNQTKKKKLGESNFTKDINDKNNCTPMANKEEEVGIDPLPHSIPELADPTETVPLFNEDNSMDVYSEWPNWCSELDKQSNSSQLFEPSNSSAANFMNHQIRVDFSEKKFMETSIVVQSFEGIPSEDAPVNDSSISLWNYD